MAKNPEEVINTFSWSNKSGLARSEHALKGKGKGDREFCMSGLKTMLAWPIEHMNRQERGLPLSRARPWKFLDAVTDPTYVRGSSSINSALQ
jgi:hypothetical protein